MSLRKTRTREQITSTNEDIHKAEMKEVLSMPPINTTVCATANRPHPQERIIQNIHRSPVFSGIDISEKG
jgi:peroxiredoxin